MSYAQNLILLPMIYHDIIFQIIMEHNNWNIQEM